MDRERAYIPRLQIEFIDLITLPVYRKVPSVHYGIVPYISSHVSHTECMVWQNTIILYLFRACRDLSRLFPSSPSPYLAAVERNRLGWSFVDAALERRGRNGRSTGSVRSIFRDGSVDREVAEVMQRQRQAEAGSTGTDKK